VSERVSDTYATLHLKEFSQQTNEMVLDRRVGCMAVEICVDANHGGHESSEHLCNVVGHLCDLSRSERHKVGELVQRRRIICWTRSACEMRLVSLARSFVRLFVQDTYD